MSSAMTFRRSRRSVASERRCLVASRQSPTGSHGRAVVANPDPGPVILSGDGDASGDLPKLRREGACRPTEQSRRESSHASPTEGKEGKETPWRERPFRSGFEPSRKELG